MFLMITGDHGLVLSSNMVDTHSGVELIRIHAKSRIYWSSGWLWTSLIVDSLQYIEWHNFLGNVCCLVVKRFSHYLGLFLSPKAWKARSTIRINAFAPWFFMIFRDICASTEKTLETETLNDVLSWILSAFKRVWSVGIDDVLKNPRLPHPFKSKNRVDLAEVGNFVQCCRSWKLFWGI